MRGQRLAQRGFAFRVRVEPASVVLRRTVDDAVIVDRARLAFRRGMVDDDIERDVSPGIRLVETGDFEAGRGPRGRIDSVDAGRVTV